MIKALFSALHVNLKSLFISETFSVHPDFTRIWIKPGIRRTVAFACQLWREISYAWWNMFEYKFLVQMWVTHFKSLLKKRKWLPYQPPSLQLCYAYLCHAFFGMTTNIVLGACCVLAVVSLAVVCFFFFFSGEMF